MREIVYRIWDEKVKRYVQDHDDFLIDPDGELHTIDIYEGEDRFCSPDRYIIEQYTGLKDKNGKRIFEGDVVTSNEYPFQDDGEYNYHGIIEWSEELTSYYLVLKIANPSKRGISDGIGEALQNYNACDLEIIGNIHNNPELLEMQE